MRLPHFDGSRLVPSGAFCAVGGIGWDSGHRIALSAGAEGAALAVTAAGFVAAGWWMFRRWGTSSRSAATGSATPVAQPPEPAPAGTGRAESPDDDRQLVDV